MGETSAGKTIVKDFYGRTKSEAEQKADAYRVENPHGPPSTDRAQPLWLFLDTWLKTWVKVHNALSTYESYLALVDLYMVDTIGQRPMNTLETLMIEEWVNELAAMGKGRTTELALRVLHAALERAVIWKILVENPAAGVKAPKFRRRKRRALTLAQTRAFLQAAGGRLDLRKPIMRKDGKPMPQTPINPRLEPLYLVYVTLGLRRGEALALRWSDIDMESGAIEISRSLDKARREGTPKTEASIRTVYADEPLIVALKAHRAAMQSEPHQEGWKPDGLIFPSETGTTLAPRNLLRHYKTVLAAAGLPSTFTIHELRHTSGSLMLASGADLTDVSKTLGHASVAITGKVYAHSYEEGKRKAVAGAGKRMREE